MASKVALARWGLLLVLVAMGGALVVSAWSNRLEAERLSELLDRGQADRLFRPIPQIHQQNGGPATSEDLARVLEQSRDDGLRYLVEYDAQGHVVAEAGESAAPAHERRLPLQVMSRVGARVRALFRPPSFAGRPPPPPPGGAPAPPTRSPLLPDLVMEFEPTVSSQLSYRATSNFVFSLTTALALAAVTISLWIAIQREERQREHRERERNLASLGEMSAVLAHEIRNPLASLKGHAQLLAEQLGPDSPYQKKIGRIVGEAKRLEELSGSLLDLVRSSSIARQATDPAALLRSALAAVDAEEVVVEATLAPASWQLDPLRMDQVLRNLLQNAAQASPRGAPIEARVAQERGKLLIQICDHGPGLPTGQEAQIFEAFHTTRTQGTGLGLAVARRIVELHGGTLDGANLPRGGAAFTIRLPP